MNTPTKQLKHLVDINVEALTKKAVHLMNTPTKQLKHLALILM